MIIKAWWYFLNIQAADGWQETSWSDTMTDMCRAYSQLRMWMIIGMKEYEIMRDNNDI